MCGRHELPKTERDGRSPANDRQDKVVHASHNTSNNTGCALGACSVVYKPHTIFSLFRCLLYKWNIVRVVMVDAGAAGAVAATSTTAVGTGAEVPPEEIPLL